MQSPATPRLPLLALFIGAVAIGFAPILVRLGHIDPNATGFFRILFALPLLWLLAATEQKKTTSPAPPSTPRDFTLLAAAGLLFAADLGLWHWSLKLTSVANSTLLANLTPLFVTIGASILFHEKISARFLLGMLLALTGATALVKTSAGVSLTHVWGDSLAASAALFYAAYILLLKQLRKRFSPSVIMAWSSLVSCTLFLLFGWLMNDSFSPPTPSAWAALVGLALIPQVAGQTLIAYALGRLPASLTATTLFIQPIVAAALAWILLAEPLTPLQTIGGFTALIGILIATRAGPIPSRSPRPPIHTLKQPGTDTKKSAR